MARYLVQTSSPVCQFFGALTYTVKINTSPPEKLPQHEIVLELLQILAKYTHNDTPTFVIRKVLSTLARLYIRYPLFWKNCICSVMATIQTGMPVLESYDVQLSEKDTIFSLEFCTIVAEELVKDHHDLNTKDVNDIISETLPNVVSLLKYTSMTVFLKSRKKEVWEKFIKSFASWVIDNKSISSFLSPVADIILEFLSSNNLGDDLKIMTFDLIPDIPYYSPATFSKSQLSRLAYILTEFGRPFEQLVRDKITHLPQNYIYEFDDDIDELYTATESISKAIIYSIEAAPTDPSYTNLVDMLVSFTNFPGVPYVDNNITMMLLEFWSSYIDSVEGNDNSLYFSTIHQVIEILWNKSRLQKSFTANWKRDDWNAFSSFRYDFYEFLDLSYGLVGVELFNTFVSNILDELTKNDWEKVEASLGCINALSDSIPAESYREDELITQLFKSDLLLKLADLDDIYIRTTGVNFIGEYDSFFENDSGRNYLFPALDYLFKALNVPSLSMTASRSIQKLCSSSREFLSSNALDSFFETYEVYKLHENLMNTAHERTVLAISYVIQAVEDLNKKAFYISKLISLIMGELERVYIRYQEQLDDGAFERILSLLRCITNVGKGLQIPDNSDQNVPKSKTDDLQNFWQADPLYIQKNLLQVVKVFGLDRSDVNKNPLITERCCAIIKSGFSEKLANPFVFPLDTVLEFIQRKREIIGTGDGYSTLVDLTCCFVSSHSVGDCSIPTQYMRSLIELFFQEDPDDPESQVGNLKLIRQIYTYYGEVIFGDGLEKIISFALKMLNSSERFTLREATQFWTALLTNPNYRKEEEFLLTQIGLELVRVLIFKISGNSARSEVDSYIDVVKSIMSKHARVGKELFQQVLVSNPEESITRRADEKQRKLLFQQLVNLRGGYETNKVLKQYWLLTRGLGTVDYTKSQD